MILRFLCMILYRFLLKCRSNANVRKESSKLQSAFSILALGETLLPIPPTTTSAAPLVHQEAIEKPWSFLSPLYLPSYPLAVASSMPNVHFVLMVRFDMCCWFMYNIWMDVHYYLQSSDVWNSLCFYHIYHFLYFTRWNTLHYISNLLFSHIHTPIIIYKLQTKRPNRRSKYRNSKLGRVDMCRFRSRRSRSRPIRFNVYRCIN